MAKTLNGTLTINVRHATLKAATDVISGDCKALVHVSIEKSLLSFKTPVVTSAIHAPRDLNFDASSELTLSAIDPNACVAIEIQSGKRVVGSASDTVKSIVATSVMKNYDLTNKSGQVVGCVTLSYVFQNAVLSKKKASAEKETAVMAASSEDDTTDEASSNSSRSAIPVHPITCTSSFSRPSLLRVTYYYDTTKSIVDYSKQHVYGLSKCLVLGESSVNYVLGTFKVKGLDSTSAVDGALAPFLSSVDGTIDASLVRVAETLSSGQSYFVHTKDAAVDSVSAAVSATVQSIVEAKDVTVSKAKEATEVTVKNVSDVSASTYKTLSGAALFLISRVPVLGKKVMAA